MKKYAFIITAVLTAALANSTFAAESFVPAQGSPGAVIQGIISDSADFGGCMVQMPAGQRPSDEGLNCPADGWVSIDCRAQHPDTGSKSDAISVFSVAQLAYVTAAPMRLVVNDAKKVNGYCIARRVVIL